MVFRTIVFKFWTLAKPTLTIMGLFLFVRFSVLRQPVSNGWLLAGSTLPVVLGLYPTWSR
jgi:hypothetical protein